MVSESWRRPGRPTRAGSSACSVGGDGASRRPYRMTMCGSRTARSGACSGVDWHSRRSRFAANLRHTHFSTAYRASHGLERLTLASPSSTPVRPCATTDNRVSASFSNPRTVSCTIGSESRLPIDLPDESGSCRPQHHQVMSIFAVRPSLDDATGRPTLTNNLLTSAPTAFCSPVNLSRFITPKPPDPKLSVLVFL